MHKCIRRYSIFLCKSNSIHPNKHSFFMQIRRHIAESRGELYSAGSDRRRMWSCGSNCSQYSHRSSLDPIQRPMRCYNQYRCSLSAICFYHSSLLFDLYHSDTVFFNHCTMQNRENNKKTPKLNLLQVKKDNIIQVGSTNIIMFILFS